MIRMATSLTGLPPPMAFRCGRAHHDHATLDPRRLVAEGDVDAIVWVSASTRTRPEWLSGSAPLIAVDANAPGNAAHHIAIGTAGVDYPAIIEPPELSGYTALSGAGGVTRLSAADALNSLKDAASEALGDLAIGPRDRLGEGVGA